MALDLPEFERPVKATSEPASLGAFSIALALCRKVALRKLTDAKAAESLSFCDLYHDTERL